MANGTAAKKHECSCGRSFRHAISLKRHQNVTGCAQTEESTAEKREPKAKTVKVATELVVACKVADEASEPTTATQTVGVKPASPKSAPSLTSVNDDRTIVITPELVAAWQAQTGFQRRTVPVVDRIAPAPTAPQKQQVDWVKLAGTAWEFVSFCGEVKTSAVNGARGLLAILAKAGFFGLVVLFSGWFMVTTVSASVTVGADENAREEIAAQTLVFDFLQNARLNQYHRAHSLLVPQARASVSIEQLQTMVNSLPLRHQPTACRTTLTRDGRSAQVVLTRDGLSEMYTLHRGDDGWGLASVSVGNS